MPDRRLGAALRETASQLLESLCVFFLFSALWGVTADTDAAWSVT